MVQALLGGTSLQDRSFTRHGHPSRLLHRLKSLRKGVLMGAMLGGRVLLKTEGEAVLVRAH